MSFSAKKKGESRLKKQYQIEQQRAVQQFRRIATEQNPNIQMILPLAEIVGPVAARRGEPAAGNGLALMQTVMEEEVRHLAGDAISSTKVAARTAGVRRTATAWWTARRCRSGKPGCVRRDSGNNVWVATNCSSVADRCSWACGTK